MRLRKCVVSIIVFAAILAGRPCTAQQVVFVDIDRPPGGDGTSWQNAYRSLQDALLGNNPLAGPVALDFWIAEGTYRPDQITGLPTGNQNRSFELYDGIRLLGGFDGTETLESQRDPDANVVILSGDLNQDDGPNFTNIGDNSRAVVDSAPGCDCTAVIDGVTIRGGNSTTRGGGIQLGTKTNLTVENCNLTANSGITGGAIAVSESVLTIIDSTITGNRGTAHSGAVLGLDESLLMITGTTIASNVGPGPDVVNFEGRLFAANSELESVRNIGTAGAGEDGIPGSFSVAGNYTQQDGAVSGALNFDLGGTNAGNTHDRVLVGQDANLRGVADLALVNGHMPTGPEVYALLKANTISDPFDLAMFPLVDGALTFQLEHTAAGSVRASLKELAQVMAFADPLGSNLQNVPRDLALGEFDQNTFTDVALAVPDPSPGMRGHAVVLVNDGTNGGNWQGFGTDVQVEVGVEPVAIAVGDLNNDLLDDIVVANYGDDTVSVLLNKGNLLGPDPFDRTDYPTGGTGPVDVALADMNMSGRLDIIIANESGTVTVLENFGGVFDFASVLEEPEMPGSVDPADIDNDKDIDIIIGDGGVEFTGILVAINVGDNEYEFGTQFPLVETPVIAESQDLNGDGLNDLTAVLKDTGALAIVLNEGGGVFSPVITVPVGGDAQSMAQADLDGDGDLDLAVVVRDGNSNRVIQVLRNDSTAAQLAYTRANQFGLEDAPLTVVAGDVDDDSIADLVSSSSPSVPLASGSEALVASRLSEPFAPCAEDSNGDGSVNVTDLLALLAAWGPCPGPCPPDTDGDGTVDVTDLLAVLASWGTCD